MKTNKRYIISIIWIVLGTVLLICSVAGILDEFWCGMGTSLLIIGIINLIRQLRYLRNKEYRENFDTQVNDERNKFISAKAWSWAGYLFVILAAVTTILLKILGFEEYMMITSSSVCIIILLYWICNLILRKKY